MGTDFFTFLPRRRRVWVSPDLRHKKNRLLFSIFIFFENTTIKKLSAQISVTNSRKQLQKRALSPTAERWGSKSKVWFCPPAASPPPPLFSHFLAGINWIQTEQKGEGKGGGKQERYHCQQKKSNESLFNTCCTCNVFFGHEKKEK